MRKQTATWFLVLKGILRETLRYSKSAIVLLHYNGVASKTMTLYTFLVWLQHFYWNLLFSREHTHTLAFRRCNFRDEFKIREIHIANDISSMEISHILCSKFSHNLHHCVAHFKCACVCLRASKYLPPKSCWTTCEPPHFLSPISLACSITQRQKNWHATHIFRLLQFN